MNKIDITFYERFKADILAGLKVITIRDYSESHFQIGEILHVATYEQNEYFCDIKVLSVTPTTLDELTEQQAKQENMTLQELKQVIKEIYPDQQQFYVIHFELV